MSFLSRIPWGRLRTTFGPAIAGLLGGAFLGLAALPSTAPLSNSVGATYAKFPSLPAPSIASDAQIPTALAVVALVLGLGLPLLTGALAVWLARPRDLWEDVSAGLTAGLAASLSAFVCCIGWAVVLAFVIVPSIADLTLVCDSQQPAANLAARYPDLEQIEAEKRGGTMMGKIVSDQVDGSAKGVRWGVLASLLTMGTLAFSGTLAAGYLSRRNERLGCVVVPYFEITVPPAVSLSWGLWLAVSGASQGLFAANPFETGIVQALGLLAISAVMIVAALRRWPWALRVCLALTGVICLKHGGQGLLGWTIVLAAMGLTGVLLLRFARTPTPKVAA